MPVDERRLAAIGDLKQEIVTFAMARRYRKQLNRFLTEQFGGQQPDDESMLVNEIDRFILEKRQPDGKTIIEHFIAAHPKLSEADRRMLAGWPDGFSRFRSSCGRANATRGTAWRPMNSRSSQ